MKYKLCSLLMAASAVQPLGAQDSISYPTKLEPVVTTVTRSRAPLASTPYSVSVRVNHGTASPSGFAVDDLLRGLPGIQLDDRYNMALGDRIAIRGVGARAQFGTRGIKVIVDGIPATFPDGQSTLNHLIPANIDRVEVIRGPAAALYGNASGGVIQCESGLSGLASTKPISQHLAVATGSFGLNQIESTTRGMSGATTFNITGSNVNYLGYRAHNSARSFNTSAGIKRLTGFGNIGLTANYVRYRALNPGGLTESLLNADRNQAFANNVSQNTGEAGRQLQAGFNLLAPLHMGSIETSIYTTNRSLDNPIPPRIIDLHRSVTGGRVSYSVPAHFIVGIESERQSDGRRNYANNSGNRGALTLDQRERVYSSALFTQLSIPVQRLLLMSAARYDRFRFSASDYLISPTNPDDSGDRTMTAFSPSGGVSFRIGNDLYLYTNVGTAFETPTTTELANQPSGAGGFNPGLQPQRTVSQEVGVRRTLADRIRYEGAIYSMRVRDVLIPFEVPDAPGRQFFRNAGSATHRGSEVAVSAVRLGPFISDVAYSQVKALFPSTLTIPGIASRQIDASLRYVAGATNISLTYHAQSRMYVNDSNTASTPGYGLANLKVTRTGRLSPYIALNNILNKQHNSSVVINAAGGRYYEPGPLRNIVVGINII